MLVLAAGPAAAEEESTSPSGSCLEEVRERVACSNPDEVCRLLLKGRNPKSGADLDQIFEFKRQDLGDGTEAYVFAHRPGGDAYAYLPSYHFERRGNRLELYFDGGGLPVRYATDRPKVGGRFQIERVSVADIPGLYRKREVEVWFWSGNEYVRAFSRVAIEGASDKKLNGTTLVWNRDTEERYKAAAPSWTYTVKSGDTLSAIARRHGVSTEEIRVQNGIRDAGSLRLGQVIRYEGWKVNAR